MKMYVSQKLEPAQQSRDARDVTGTASSAWRAALHDSPRQAAQRQQIAAAFGTEQLTNDVREDETAAHREAKASADTTPVLGHNEYEVVQRVGDGTETAPTASVVQCVPAGRYVTKTKGKLLSEDHKVLLELLRGTPAIVHAGAATARFKTGKIAITKSAHTWTHVQDKQGWLKDSVLGTAVNERADSDLDARQLPRATTSGTHIDVGMESNRRAQSTTSLDELAAYRDADDATLEYPGLNHGANPLNQGKPSKVEATDYSIAIRGGALRERTGRFALTVQRSPFVLSTDGKLYGGQGDRSEDFSLDLGYEPAEEVEQSDDTPLSLMRVDKSVMQSHAHADVGMPAWAGELAAKDGKVTYINNQSGTFMLSDKANINIIKFLYRHGVLGAEQIRDLGVERVSEPGIDRNGKLERHQVLG